MIQPAVLVLASCLILWAPQSTTPQTATAVVYANVLDNRGAPILDLTANDFVVKEDGKVRDLVSVERAGGEMQVVILLDDNGTGVFRYGLHGLAELLQGRASISLRLVTSQVERVFDFTSDPKVWFAGLARTGVRPATPEGGQLLEGIFEASRTFRGPEARHPVIIALTVGGDEQSPRQSRPVLDELRRSRASLHVVYAQNPTSRPIPPTSRPSDLLGGNFNLSKVLGDGPKESGGRRRKVLAMNSIQAEVQAIARDLLNQYEIHYLRSNVSRVERLQVYTTKPGLTVVAPTRAPLN